MEYCLPMETDGHWPWYKIDRTVHCMSGALTVFHYKEPAIFYEQRPYNIRYQDIPLKSNILLEGHFQSEKYFAHCKEEIINLFGRPGNIEHGKVSIHIRRGDYLNMQGHLPVVTMNYLQAAIHEMVGWGHTHFVVFGDDFEWNRENLNHHVFPGLTLTFEFVKPADPLEEVRMASRCAHNIGSNSSFSWWIYYLNRNPEKIGIFPKQWFGPAYGEVDTKDLYPEGSIKL